LRKLKSVPPFWFPLRNLYFSFTNVFPHLISSSPTLLYICNSCGCQAYGCKQSKMAARGITGRICFLLKHTPILCSWLGLLSNTASSYCVDHLPGGLQLLHPAWRRAKRACGTPTS
jgi:hypothetical protein